MALACPKVQLTEPFLPPILLNVSEYSHTLRGENMAGETRQKILDATEKLLLLKGLARVTTKEIARETGLSEGALYRHFDHKEEIFFALMARHLAAFHETFQAHQAGTGSPSENLAAIALAALHYYDQLVPMGASFLADTVLLAEFRATIRAVGVGPENVFELG